MDCSLTYSFDVYDTCLTRLHLRPTDLFYDLASFTLSNSSTRAYNQKAVHEFARLRILAERLSRQENNGHREDITIIDIYRKFIEISPWRIGLDSLVQSELELERNYTIPILSTLSEIRNLRNAGLPILFISDMYLPTAFIKEQLQKHGFADANSQVYVSGDIGVTKHTGNLFNYVLEKNKLLSCQLMHTGDNEFSDIKVPTKLGIKAKPYIESHLTEFQKNRAVFIQSALESKLLGIGRIARLSSSRPGLQSVELETVIYDVVAPLILGYTSWVLRDAELSKIDRLYFISRDGQILHKLARRLSQQWGGPECLYLYGSRAAWFLPSISTVDWNDIYKKFVIDQLPTVSSTIKRLNLTPDEIREILEDCDIGTIANAGIEEIKWLVSHPKIAALILDKAQSARELALNYFEQEGLLKDEHWAIVDVGWRLKAQGALREILKHRNSEIATKTKGYYLAVDAHREEEHFTALIDGRLGEYSWLFKRSASTLLEHFFLVADHPPVIGYERGCGVIKPTLHDETYTHSPSLVASLHEAILHYVDIALENGFQAEQAETLFHQAMESFRQLYQTPNQAHAQVISEFQVCLDQTHDKNFHQNLAGPLRFVDIINFSLAYLFKHPAGNFKHFWLEGSLALSSWPTKTLAQLLLAIRRSFD